VTARDGVRQEAPGAAELSVAWAVAVLEGGLGTLREEAEELRL